MPNAKSKNHPEAYYKGQMEKASKAKKRRAERHRKAHPNDGQSN